MLPFTYLTSMAKNVICIQASAKDCLVQPVRLQTKTLSLQPNTICCAHLPAKLHERWTIQCNRY